MSFSFIHAADLHLDSPFSCLSPDLPEELMEAIVNAQFEVFKRLIELAKKTNCSFLCFSGDVFDSGEFCLSAKTRFLNEMSGLAHYGIKTFMVLGNHDPLESEAIASTSFGVGGDDLFIFTHELENISIKTKDGSECLISGISFREKKESRNLALYFKDIKVPKDAVSIGLLHTNCGGVSGHGNYAPCTISDLTLSSVDYWALGHIHKYQYLKESHPVIVYPGIIQGRHFGEIGPKGCILVKVEEGPTFRPTFINLDVIRWDKVVIRMEKTSSLDELSHQILRSIGETIIHKVNLSNEAYPTKFKLLRIVLTGRARLKKITYREELLNDLKESLNASLFERHRIWVDEIRDMTSSSKDDPLTPLVSSDLITEILTMTEKFKDDDALKSVLLKELDTFFRKREIARALEVPDGEALIDLISEARDLIIELIDDDDISK